MEELKGGHHASQKYFEKFKKKNDYDYFLCILDDDCVIVFLIVYVVYDTNKWI